MDDEPQGAVVPGQGHQPQGQGIHQGTLARTYLVAAPKQLVCMGGGGGK